MLNRIKEIFVFDVESIGLYGEPFAVAGGIYSADGKRDEEFKFCCKKNLNNADKEDITWVKKNVKKMPLTHNTLFEMREAFWKEMNNAKQKHPDILICAECLWPLEARFMIDCVKQHIDLRKWHGAYPFHEIASFMLAANMDPMKIYERIPDELPEHDPIGDCRLSARLFFEAIKKLNN